MEREIEWLDTAERRSVDPERGRHPEDGSAAGFFADVIDGVVLDVRTRLAERVRAAWLRVVVFAAVTVVWHLCVGYVGWWTYHGLGWPGPVLAAFAGAGFGLTLLWITWIEYRTLQGLREREARRSRS